MKSHFPWRPILLGALTVGTLDILDAFIFFHFRGVPPLKILQSIASGLLGAGAFSGGSATALLGTICHFTIACGIVLAFYFIAHHWPAAIRHVAIAGPLYGIVVWATMNFIVVPLSAAKNPNLIAPIVFNGLAIHMIGIGLPAVIAVREALRTRSSTIGG